MVIIVTTITVTNMPEKTFVSQDNLLKMMVVIRGAKHYYYGHECGSS